MLPCAGALRLPAARATLSSSSLHVARQLRFAGCASAALSSRRPTARPRRRAVSVATAALDAAVLAPLFDSAVGAAGAVLDLMLGGAPTAYAATAGIGPEAAALHLPESISWAATAAVAVGGPLAFKVARDATVKTVSPAEAAQLLAAGALLVDVRDSAASARSGPSAPHYAAVKWANNRDFADACLFAADASPIVLCDAAGALSARAAKELVQKCRNDVYVVDGGLQAWVAARQAVFGDVALTPEALAAEAAAGEQAAAAHSLSLTRFNPKLLTVLAEGYGGDELRRDVLSGLSVGVIALSLSMALGIASESTPAAGLYTAVSAGFVISALGGSRVAIGGPTAAFIPILIGVSHEYGAEALVTCTVMAGGMLVAMGALGLGTLITKIPKPVITGFTAGIATFIFSTQLKDFFGLGSIGAVPAQFLEKLLFLGSHLDATHAPSLALATGALVLLRTYPASWARNVPPQIVAVVAGTLVVASLEAAGVHTGIQTIGSRFGEGAIPSGLPMPHLALPESLDTFEHLLQPAFTIALLAAIESLLCAVVADGMIDDKHDSNQELIAQGLANIASASVGGLPTTGALARTAANVRSGGRSPVSGMVHAAVVLGIMVVAAPLGGMIPLPALSAVLVVVAINMGEWRNFSDLPNWPKTDAAVFLTAFMLTVLTDVTVAVECGLLLSMVLYVKRVGEASEVVQAALPAPSDAPVGTRVLQLSGGLLFGCADKLEAAAAAAVSSPDARVLLLDCSALVAVDNTGIEALAEAQHKLHKAGKSLVLSGLSQQPHTALSSAGLLERVGHANVVRDAASGASRARALLLPAHASGSNGSGAAAERTAVGAAK